ncbi:vWA domain-containing protein [Ferviditalea candida]|uniref:VWA domain-containing protein n=1 Tax=Ferviditalea candida TaxID=3108399 RepID=A0ABU5ZLW7_9BACL|nr:VWA domain-containing protein [Paenibacillaceae bacterium T2]
MQWLAFGNLAFLWMFPAIILLYILKRKYEDQAVASILLWQRVLQNREANRPWQKLERYLLLFLQLLVALLLLLALLRPAVPVEGAIAAHTVLVIDSSGSMLAREGQQTRLELSKQAALKVVEHLGSNQRLTLVEMGREPKVLVSKSGDQAALRQALNGIVPRAGTGDSRAALSLAKAIAASEPGSGIMWFGDGDRGRMAESDFSALQPEAFRHIQPGVTQDNLAVGSFVTQLRDGRMEGLLRIDNYGLSERKGRAVIYDREHRVLDVGNLTVAAKGSFSLSFSDLPSSPAYEAELEIKQDALSEDNRAWSVPFASGKARAVLVSPAGNRFLTQALLYGNRVELETMNRLPDRLDDKVDLWIFDGVVPKQLPKGNLLLVAPAESASWFEAYGTQKLTRPLETNKPEHPLLAYADLKDVHVAEHVAWKPISGMEPLVSSGDQAVISAGTLQGRRAVILGFDLHQSDFPLRPAFPIFMQNSLSWLSPAQSVPIGTAYPGETVVLPLTPGAAMRVLIQPDGKQIQVDGQGSVYLYAVPEQTGLFTLRETRGRDELTRYFAVQMRAAESDIAPKTLQVPVYEGDEKPKGDAGQQLQGMQVKGMKGLRELAVWLVLAALLTAFAEWAVYRRGY